MVARNDITGDSIQTKGVSNAYRDNYDNIFKKITPTDKDHTDGYEGKQPEGSQSERNVNKDR